MILRQRCSVPLLAAFISLGILPFHSSYVLTPSPVARAASRQSLRLESVAPDASAAGWILDNVGYNAILLASMPEIDPLVRSPVIQPDSVDASLGLSPETTIAVFIVGIIPFAVATVEFWRRIAVGASFGTSDPVVFTIGEDNAPTSSRGKQVLGKDALITAYAIFATVAVVLGIVFVSVLSSPIPGSM
jgi:hypothetical protein